MNRPLANEWASGIPGGSASLASLFFCGVASAERMGLNCRAIARPSLLVVEFLEDAVYPRGGAFAARLSWPERVCVTFVNSVRVKAYRRCRTSAS